MRQIIGFLYYLVLGKDGVVGGDGELVVIHGSGDLLEGLGGVRLLVLEETNDGHIGLLGKGLGGIHISDGNGGGSGLLLQPGDDGVRGPELKEQLRISKLKLVFIHVLVFTFRRCIQWAFRS